MDNNSLSNVLLVFLAIWLLISCGLLVLIIIFAIFAFRWSRRFLTPDITAINARYQVLRAANPQATTEQLVHKIINQQALRAGIVGAITGIGGFVTLPVTLPIDLLVSLRIQATMVQFIATIYGFGNPDSEELKLQTYIVMSGGTEATEASFNVIMRIIVRLVGETFSILLPVFGLAVGFGVNYAIAEATGNIAMRWYSTRAALPAPQSAPRLKGQV